MGAPAIAVGAMVGFAGTMMESQAQASADMAAANAERRNAAFAMEAAEFERQSSLREQEIFKREAALNFGEQVSGFAKAGVDLSGSPLLVLADSKRVAGTELSAIKREGEFRIRRAILQGRESSVNARNLQNSSKGRQIGGLLTGFGGFASSASRIRNTG